MCLFLRLSNEEDHQSHLPRNIDLLSFKIRGSAVVNANLMSFSIFNVFVHRGKTFRTQHQADHTKTTFEAHTTPNTMRGG